jgi:hypothetical protein
MKRGISASLFIVAASLPAVAGAQLISERVEGNQRLCAYRGASGLTTGSEQSRVFRVGVGENCPNFFPLIDNNRPPPPTAPLSNDLEFEHSNGCVYRQWGQSWTYQPPAGSHCPPVAGLIPTQTSPPARSR